MASTKNYLDFILEQLSDLDEISYKAMMGEYIIYYRGKIIGGIYDDRFLVKPVKSAISLMPDATFEIPYDGAKEMILVDNIDDKEFLTKLFNTMYDELEDKEIYIFSLRGVPLADISGVQALDDLVARLHKTIRQFILQPFSRMLWKSSQEAVSLRE